MVAGLQQLNSHYSILSVFLMRDFKGRCELKDTLTNDDDELSL